MDLGGEGEAGEGRSEGEGKGGKVAGQAQDQGVPWRHAPPAFSGTPLHPPHPLLPHPLGKFETAVAFHKASHIQMTLYNAASLYDDTAVPVIPTGVPRAAPEQRTIANANKGERGGLGPRRASGRALPVRHLPPLPSLCLVPHRPSHASNPHLF